MGELLESQDNVQIIFQSFLNKFNLSKIYLEKLRVDALEYHKGSKIIYRAQWTYYQHIRRSLTLYKNSRIPDDDPRFDDKLYKLECAWMECNKLRSKNQKLYICKGCKLLAYCCRSHQKKHWNCSHTQQCIIKRHKNEQLRKS